MGARDECVDLFPAECSSIQASLCLHICVATIMPGLRACDAGSAELMQPSEGFRRQCNGRERGHQSKKEIAV